MKTDTGHEYFAFYKSTKDLFEGGEKQSFRSIKLPQNHNDFTEETSFLITIFSLSVFIKFLPDIPITGSLAWVSNDFILSTRSSIESILFATITVGKFNNSGLYNVNSFFNIKKLSTKLSSLTSITYSNDEHLSIWRRNEWPRPLFKCASFTKPGISATKARMIIKQEE